MTFNTGKLPIIKGLRPHIIPHAQWALHRWYSHTPLWYYHRPEPQPALNRSKHFYREVDPDLRSLCKALHERGIHTGPSCQGHFYVRERFERIWEQMRMEACAIRSGGLFVTNSETDESFSFQDARFEFPWSRFERFYDKIASHQSCGYLAIVFTQSTYRMADRLARRRIDDHRFSLELDDDLSDALHSPLIHIRVRASHPAERRAVWDEVEELINREAFGR